MAYTLGKIYEFVVSQCVPFDTPLYVGIHGEAVEVVGVQFDNLNDRLVLLINNDVPPVVTETILIGEDNIVFTADEAREIIEKAKKDRDVQFRKYVFKTIADKAEEGYKYVNIWNGEQTEAFYLLVKELEDLGFKVETSVTYFTVEW